MHVCNDRVISRFRLKAFTCVKICFFSLSLIIGNFTSAVPSISADAIEQFQTEHPAVASSLAQKFGLSVGEKIIEELLLLEQEFGAESVLRSFWKHRLDSFNSILNRMDIKNASADIIARMLFKEITKEMIYFTFGPKVDADLIGDFRKGPFVWAMMTGAAVFRCFEAPDRVI